MFAGIDWGGHRHQLAVVVDGGKVVTNRSCSHDRGGRDELVSALGRYGAAEVPVAIERCGGVLVERLFTNGFGVFPVGPQVSA